MEIHGIGHRYYCKVPIFGSIKRIASCGPGCGFCAESYYFRQNIPVSAKTVGKLSRGFELMKGATAV
jgi:hypothetical protein